MKEPSSQVRMGILGIVMLSLLVTLFARLWFLQVASSPEFQEAAQANRVRVVQVQAPRGRILDRNGRVVVDNRVSVVVAVERSSFNQLADAEAKALLARLSEDLTRAGDPVTVDELRERINDQRFSQYTPVPVAQDMPEELKIYIEEHAEDFPGVIVERTPVRSYPFGRVGAHVLGYVGEINDVELEEREDEPKTYIQGDDIGKSGVERVYEDDLRGVPGFTYVEVNAHGDPVRILEDQSTAPMPGNDLVLTVDFDLQALTEQTLDEELAAARERRPSGANKQNEAPAGSALVQDPRNGEILAMASFPTYDPSQFVNGISTTRWNDLNDPANHFPLNNWAIQGQYAPGSTFKLFTAYAAVTSGFRTPEFELTDTGVYQVPNCGGGAGCIFRSPSTKTQEVDLRKAMTVSSDVYFYDVGAQLWIQRERFGSETIQDAASEFGLGTRTGIALPSEQPGRIPTAEAREEMCEEMDCLDPEWYTGDNVNMAIGQGDVAVTPLQLANAYSSFANGGTLYEPSVAVEIRENNSEEVIRSIEHDVTAEIPMAPEVRQPILDGLIGVTTEPGGTGFGLFEGFPNDMFPVAGKTGTAQVSGKADTSVFSGFGPASDPRFTVTAILEESGFGASAAGPVVRRMFDVLSGTAPAPTLEPGGRLAAPPPPPVDEQALLEAGD